MTPEKQTVIVCQKCDGYGIITDTDQRGPITKSKQIVCPVCKGSGRQLVTTTITYKPYKPQLLC